MRSRIGLVCFGKYDAISVLLSPGIYPVKNKASVGGSDPGLGACGAPRPTRWQPPLGGRSRPRPDPSGWVFRPIKDFVLRHFCSAFLEGVPLTAPTPLTNRGVGTVPLAG